jgi:endogenous inhibitor of DNA gyrase (YacG/DUF329 family)
MPRCVICKKVIAARKRNQHYPFCSPRCRLIDLGKWLGEGYRIAGRPEENEDELPAPTQDNDDGKAP